MADCVQFLLGGELEKCVVLFGEGANAQVDTGQMDPFKRANLPGGHNLTMDLLVNDFFDSQADKAIVDEKEIAMASAATARVAASTPRVEVAADPEPEAHISKSSRDALRDILRDADEDGSP